MKLLPLDDSYTGKRSAFCLCRRTVVTGGNRQAPDSISSTLAQKHVDFEFILTMRPNGKYAVMALVEGRTIYKNIQHHWMYDALTINVSPGKVGYGLVGISFEMATIEVIHE